MLVNHHAGFAPAGFLLALLGSSPPGRSDCLWLVNNRPPAELPPECSVRLVSVLHRKGLRGSVNLLGVQPQIRFKGGFQGQKVVLHIVSAHSDPQPCGGDELHGLGGGQFSCASSYPYSGDSRRKSAPVGCRRDPFPSPRGKARPECFPDR